MSRLKAGRCSAEEIPNCLKDSGREPQVRAFVDFIPTTRFGGQGARQAWAIGPSMAAYRSSEDTVDVAGPLHSALRFTKTGYPHPTRWSSSVCAAPVRSSLAPR
jgi:hypothetical protein